MIGHRPDSLDVLHNAGIYTGKLFVVIEAKHYLYSEVELSLVNKDILVPHDYKTFLHNSSDILYFKNMLKHKMM